MSALVFDEARDVAPEEQEQALDEAWNETAKAIDSGWEPDVPDLAKAVMLADELDVAEALLRGESVPVKRLRPEAVTRLGTRGGVHDRAALADFNAIPAAAENGSSERAHSWTPIDLVEIDECEQEQPSISGLVYPGRRHVFSGEPETLKTWCGDVLCVEQIRAGHEVVYVDFEMGAQAQAARMRALGLSDEEMRRFLYMAPSEALTDVLPLVETFLEFVRPPLVVIDAFTGVLAANNVDENSNVEVENFYQSAITPIQRVGAAVVLIDHVTKDKEKRGRYSIASSRKLGATDVHLGFELVRPFSRGHTGLAKIRTHKDRPGGLMRPYAGEIELVSSGEAVNWQVRVAADDDTYHRFRPTVLMERVSLYVNNCAEPQSRNAVEEAVRGKREFVREAIDALVHDGYLSEEEGPRGARVLRSIEPFRDPERSPNE